MLEAVIPDDEGDPTKAVLEANKLISKDEVIAILGPSLTPTSLAIIPVVEKAGVPLISCAAGIKITEPVKPLVFKTAQNDVLAVAAIYRHMQGKNIKKIGIITVENAFGESGKEQLVGLAPKYGIEIVQAETFGAKDTDMTAQLAKIRAAQPDAIVCWGTNPGPAVIARNAVQMNMKIPLYQSHGVASPKFIELAESAAEGILLPTGKILVADQLPDSDPQKPVLQKYIADFEKRYSMPVSGFGGYAYDSMHLLAAALKGTEGDKQKIAENLEKIHGFHGVTGTFTFSPADHNGLGRCLRDGGNQKRQVAVAQVDAGMQEFLQYIFSGVTNGAVYAIIALGFSMLYSTTGLINFAQGEFVMIGALSLVSLWKGFHLPLPFAFAGAVAVTAIAGAPARTACNQERNEAPSHSPCHYYRRRIHFAARREHDRLGQRLAQRSRVFPTIRLSTSSERLCFPRASGFWLLPCWSLPGFMFFTRGFSREGRCSPARSAGKRPGSLEFPLTRWCSLPLP